MIQLGANHIWYLIAAAQWTVLLSLIAFVGGALLGLPIALMRVSPVHAPVSYTHLTLPTNREV